MQQTFDLSTFFYVLILLVYLCLSHWLERMKHKYLQGPGMAIILGIFMGIILHVAYEQESAVKFADLYAYLLPPIIFNMGFNTTGESLMAAGRYIMHFGIVASLIFFAALMLVINSLFSHFTTLDGQPINASVYQGISLAAALVAVECTPGMCQFPADRFPKLRALLIGEGLLNNIVAILLSCAVAAEPPPEPSQWPPMGLVGFKVLYFLITSASTGFLFGLTISFVYNQLSDSPYSYLLYRYPSRSVALLFIWAYLGYVVADYLQFSPLLTLMCTALTMANYAWHSLSQEGRVVATEATKVASYFGEAMVFGSFGFALVAAWRRPGALSIPFILVLFLLVIALRFAILYTIAGIVYVCDRLFIRCCSPEALMSEPKGKELLLLALTGGIRGTVAYALILARTPPLDMRADSDRLLNTTVVGVSVLSVLLLDGLTPLALRLLKATDGIAKDADALPLKQPFLDGAPSAAVEGRSADRAGGGAHARLDPGESPSSRYESLPLSPSRRVSHDARENAEPAQPAAEPRKKGLAKWWSALDREYLRPLFGGQPEETLSTQPSGSYPLPPPPAAQTGPTAKEGIVRR